MEDTKAKKEETKKELGYLDKKRIGWDKFDEKGELKVKEKKGDSK